MNTTQPNDGGPAFPVTFEHAECTSETAGMSLRDWFAGQVLGAFVQRNADDSLDGLDVVASRARIAYAYADAMIEERKNKSNE